MRLDAAMPRSVACRPPGRKPRVTTVEASGLHIRPAARSDAEGIAAVHVASWAAAYRGIVPDAALDDDSVEGRAGIWDAILSGAKPPEAHLVAAFDGRIVGFASVGRSRDADAGRRVGELAALYVHPDSWRAGVGGRLLREAERSLARAGFAAVTLWVLRDNRAGRGFYESRGWSADGSEQLHPFGERGARPVVRYRKELDGRS
jgi:ribosomal protein S18 acetylase RimI-like enzyme